MSFRYHAIAVLLLGAFVAPSMAGLTVTSHQTVAHTNAYAPLSQTQYFADQTLTNVTPALAEVSADWLGTNIGGGTPTWNWIGSAHATSTTVFDLNGLTVAAAGSFSHDLTTTSEFIDPSSSTIYSPGSAANYDCFFQLDIASGYTIAAQLNQRGRVRLSSFEGDVVFDQINLSSTPLILNLTGMIPAGHYEFLATSSIGVPNLSNGTHHIFASGSHENVIFTVQVPEPTTFGAVILIIVKTTCRRGRRYDCASST